MSQRAPDTDNLAAEIAIVAEAWRESPYYKDAENWTFLFWAERTEFRKLFDRLDLTSVIELACGHGRHAEQIIDRAGRLILMDIFEENLEVCRGRLGARQNVDILKGDGSTFLPLPDASATSIFCYDAMVHFSPAIVQSYLNDAERVLQGGGMILLHHSNYSAPAGRLYGRNPHARNHMTRELFKNISDSARLEIVEQQLIPWGGVAELDCITLLAKP